jgi:hypothetical protein
MAVGPVAEITAVGFFEDQFDERIPAEGVRQRPGCRLVAPHQWGVNDKAVVHAERQRHLQRLQSVVAAIGITRIIGLAHAADEMPRPAAIADGGGKGEEQQIAAGDKRIRQSALLESDRGVTGQRRVADLAQDAEIDDVVVAELAAPVREFPAQTLDRRGTAI